MTTVSKMTGKTLEVRSDNRKPREDIIIDIMDLIDIMDIIDIMDLRDIMDLINIMEN